MQVRYLIRIINRVLEKDPEDRYQSMKDIVIELKRLKKHSGDISRKVLLESSSNSSLGTSAKEIQKNDLSEKENSLNSKNSLINNKINERITSNKKTKLIVTSSVIGFIALIIGYLLLFSTRGLEKAASAKTLAVMYFEDIPDPEDKDHTGEMLTNLLITSLSQIKGLEVISRERLLDIQKDIGNVTIKSLSPTLVEQVANKAGVTTMLLGSILEKQPTLAVTTRLIDVKTGKILSSERITNFQANQIFNLVDSLAYLLRNRLKINSEYLNDIKPVADVTTNSPEAYRAYVEGLDSFYKIYNKEAYTAFLKAVELDTNFAMAYFNLSFVQQYLGYAKDSWQSIQKAVKLVDKVTEHERAQILARNYQLQNKPDKAAKILEKVIDRYPHEIEAYNSLGYDVYFLRMMQLKKVMEIFSRGVKNNPSAKLLWNQLAYSFAFLNQKQESIKAIKKCISLAPAEPNPYDSEGDIYAWFMEYDSSRTSYLNAIRLRKDITACKLGFDSILRQKYKNAEKYFEMSEYLLPVIEIHKGQLKKTAKKLTETLDSQISPKDRLPVLVHLAYEMGKFQEMLNLADQLSLELRKDPSDKIYGRDYLAWALTKNGKLIKAHEVLDDMQKDVNNLSPILQITVDYSLAMVSFEEGKNEIALEKFRKIFKSLPPVHEPNIFYAICQLKCMQIQPAIAELKRILYWPDMYLLSNVLEQIMIGLSQL